MPIRCRKIIEDNLQELSKIACQIYIDDDEYYFLGINGVGMLPIQTESLELEHKHIVSCDWFLSCVIKCHRTLFKRDSAALTFLSGCILIHQFMRK